MNRGKGPQEPDFPTEAQNACGYAWRQLLNILDAGDRGGSFRHTFDEIGEDDWRLIGDLGVHGWLDATGRTTEHVEAIRRTQFPMLVSDFMSFVEAVFAAVDRRQPMVAYAILRKPIQENLGALEWMACDPEGYLDRMKGPADKRDVRNSGGMEKHKERIHRVVRVLDASDIFDSEFLAALRYGKTTAGSFAAASNVAMHLVTRDPIETSRFFWNLSDPNPARNRRDLRYLMARLPYLLDYARRVAEHVFQSFEDRSPPLYLADMERRCLAVMQLWGLKMAPDEVDDGIAHYHNGCHDRLRRECEGRGGRVPHTATQLERLVRTGVFPGMPKRLRVSLKLERVKATAMARVMVETRRLNELAGRLEQGKGRSRS